MAIPAIALAAGRAAVTYAPAVYNTAKAALTKATGGKATEPSDVAKYVGTSPQRLTVVADAFVRSGIHPEDIFPADIVSTQPQLVAMRDAANRLAQSLQQQFNQGADRVIPASSSADMAADVIRVERVKAVLRVYGDEKSYFLCHPNGGVPSADFAYVRALRTALSRV